MTQLLKRLIEQAQRLPAAEQDRLARRWLEELEALPQAARPSAASAYDLAEHVAGSLEGPGDLSTNPAYLDDLGERSLR